MPGDVVTEDLLVTNAGVEDFRYAMTTTATNALGDELDLEVRAEDGDGGCDDFDGAAAITPVADARRRTPSATRRQGQDTGDRFLAGGASEVLCFRVTLPLDADTARPGADLRRRRSPSTQSRPSTTRNPHVGCTRPVARPRATGRTHRRHASQRRPVEGHGRGGAAQ